MFVKTETLVLSASRSGRTVSVFLTLVIAFCASIQLQAADPPLVDTIHLKNGGVLYGTAKEVTENKQRLWLVTTTDGTMLKLRRGQVARVTKPSAEIREYLQKKATLPETVDAHWAMQQWCLGKRLKRERDFHLLRVIELDPDHKDARARLGYKDYEGIWVHEEHFKANQGYVKDSRGAYRLPVAIEMHQREEAAKAEVTEWNKKIKNLMTKVTKRNDRVAWKQLTEIKDGAAVPGLIKVFDSTNDVTTKRMVIDVLGKIESGHSQNALVVIATTAPDGLLDLRERAVTMLLQPHFDRASICGTVDGFLRPSPTSKRPALVNGMCNRAAWLIGKMEFTPAIRPLIDALNTVHTVPIGQSGNANAGFGDEGAALDWGKKASHIKKSFQNTAVLDTLRLLVPGGVDFGFDEAAWTAWYVQENALRTNQLGRDN